MDEKTYREQRKARIAKQAKKKNTGMNDEQLDRLGKLIGKVIAVVVCVALCAGLLVFFGVPQKLMPAVKAEDRTYSVAEYNYFYMATFLTYYNQASSYDSQYGEGMGKLFTGYDVSIAPDKQTKTVDNEDAAPAEEGVTLAEGETTAVSDENKTKEITFTEFFHDQAVAAMEQNAYYLKLAKEAGITLDADKIAEVEEQMTQLQTYADNNQFSLSRFLSVQYGRGLNKRIFRNLLEEQALVDAYLASVTDGIAAEISDAEIEEEYNKDPGAYQVADIRLFGFPLEAYYTNNAQDGGEPETPAHTDAEQEARAAEFVEKATSVEEFVKLAREYAEESEKASFQSDDATAASHITRSTVQSNVDADAADWVMSAAEGEVKSFATDEYIYIVMIEKAAYRNEEPLRNVRHCLVMFDNAATLENDVPANADLKELALAYANGEAAAEAGTGEETTAPADAAEETADGEEVYTKKSQYLAEAGRYLQEYLGAETVDEKAFATMCDNHSDDTSSTTAGNGEGGLIADMDRGTYVTEFENWAYADHEPGDTGIIETSYGYHIMYFVSEADEAKWKADIRSTLATEKQTENEEATQAQYKDTATECFSAKWAKPLAEKFVVKYFDRINSSN